MCPDLVSRAGAGQDLHLDGWSGTHAPGGTSVVRLKLDVEDLHEGSPDGAGAAPPHKVPPRSPPYAGAAAIGEGGRGPPTAPGSRVALGGPRV
ncbi:predicted protein [Streptomyces viridochromogenes DSM 40736]|uniref:Predicted protein n=1 Tax=Streptomyces viridochromogenes (strain DSM 40736 / JCM 4977 / BCRC 1201 / Tue 494) TaxID=591159 RepID=D9X7W7_STRVT|nr:predicted protein [Streptomyces viridochromogenes DSM 40736]